MSNPVYTYNLQNSKKDFNLKVAVDKTLAHVTCKSSPKIVSKIFTFKKYDITKDSSGFEVRFNNCG